MAKIIKISFDVEFNSSGSLWKDLKEFIENMDDHIYPEQKFVCEVRHLSTSDERTLFPAEE